MRKLCFTQPVLSLIQLLLIISCGMAASGASAQKLFYDSYSINDGLSDRTVNDIFTTDHGFIWIATNNGLNRFDGYGFLQFDNRVYQASNQRLTNDEIQEIEQIANGDFLLISKNSLSFDLFNPKTFHVRHIKTATVGKGIEGHPLHIRVDHQGHIYLVAAKEEVGTAVYRYEPEVDTFTEVLRLAESWERKVPNGLQLLPLRNGNFLLHDEEHGLRLVSRASKVLRTFALDPYIKPPTHDHNVVTRASIFRQTKDGLVWLAFANRPGLFCWDGREGDFLPCEQFDQRLTYSHLWEDEQGNKLFNQGNYVGEHARSQQILCLPPGAAKPLDFSDLLEVGNYILSVDSKDFFRSLFVGTDSGLKTVQYNRSLVRQYLSTPMDEDRRGIVVRGITGDGNGHVYFTREMNHWLRLNLDTDVLDTIYLHEEGSGKLLDFSCGLDLEYDAVGNYLWGIGCVTNQANPGRLLRYDLDQCVTRKYEYVNSFTCMAADHRNKLWLGAKSSTNEGELLYFDKNSPSLFVSFLDHEGKNPFEKVIPRYMLESKDGTLWVGTDNGLFHIYPDRREYAYYHSQGGEGVTQLELRDNAVLVLYEDEHMDLWIGTKDGLHRFSPQTGELDYFSSDDGLTSNTVCGILPGQNGDLWVSTYNGLTYFSLDTDKSRRFFHTDGFSHDEFNRFSFYRDERGRYYFGSVNGLNAFRAEDMLVERVIPAPLLTGFSRYDKRSNGPTEQTEGLSNLKEIVIKPSDKYFVLDFALPVYTRPSKNRFRFRMSGENKEWINIDNEHSLRFNNLKAGRYSLEVQGADPNGYLSAELLTLDIIVREVFYWQWWFLLLLALGVGLVIYGVSRYHLRQELRMERLRTRLSSDLHDEVSGLLAGIAMQSELLYAHGDDRELDTRISRISAASRRAMSKMSDVIWSIDSRRDHMEDMLSRMQEHADDVLHPINISYDFQVERLDTARKVPANIRQDLFLIYKEVINNIAKHSQADHADIRLGNYGPYFEMIIRDNGRGNVMREESPIKRGQGLSNLKMRAQRLNAQLIIQNDNGYVIHLRMKKFS